MSEEILHSLQWIRSLRLCRWSIWWSHRVETSRLL